MRKFIILVLTLFLAFSLCSCDQYEAMQRKIEELEEANQSLQKDINNLTAKTESDKSELQNNIDNLKDSANEALLDLQGDINSVALDKEKIKTDLDNLNDKVNNDVTDINDNIHVIDCRLDSKYCHINPTTGNVENHTFGDWVHTSTGHYKECSICGYRDNVNLHDFYTSKSPLTHKCSCDTCGYSENGIEPHNFDYAKIWTTEAEFKENYPTTAITARGTIRAAGSYSEISFANLPHYTRSSTESVVCEEEDCGTEVYKILNAGDGTVTYRLTHYPELQLEVYVEEANEYMLKLETLAGDSVIYLRNYSISTTVEDRGDVTTYRWECSGGEVRKYKDGVLKESQAATGENPLTNFVDWNGKHSWTTIGDTIEGEVYFMEFGDVYQNWNRVAFQVADGNYVEAERYRLPSRSSK